MLDFVTDAIILKKEPLGDYDSLYTLFTENRGKVSAKATSARKITSKLVAHLEPGLHSRVRLVTRGAAINVARFQVVDALRERQLFSDALFLDLIDGLALAFHKDETLWKFLLTGNADKKSALALCGFGGEQLCVSCGFQASAFYHSDQEFLCLNCSSLIPKKLVTYLS